MSERTALDEAEAAVARLNSRVRTLARLLTAAFVVIVVGAVSLLGQYAILSSLDSGIAAVNKVSVVSECRTRVVVEIDQIKDAPDRTPLALELLAPSTPPDRKAEITDRFTKDSERIKKLQDKRLACKHR